MNLHTASTYFKTRYRIRRPSWEPEEYLEYTDELSKVAVSYFHTFNMKKRKTEKHRRVRHEIMNLLSLEDLIATDWELITTGIKTHFNKYGHVEYEESAGW